MRPVRLPVRDDDRAPQRTRARRRQVDPTSPDPRPVLQLPLRSPVEPAPVSDHDRGPTSSVPSEPAKSDRGVAVVDFYI